MVFEWELKKCISQKLCTQWLQNLPTVIADDAYRYSFVASSVSETYNVNENNT